MDWSKVHRKLAGRFRLLERRNEDGDCVIHCFSSTSHSQEVTTRNLHKKVSFIFNPSRAVLQMQALAHLLVQV